MSVTTWHPPQTGTAPETASTAQNPRMLWFGSCLKDHLAPAPLPSAGTAPTRPGLIQHRPYTAEFEHCQV